MIYYCGYDEDEQAVLKKAVTESQCFKTVSEQFQKLVEIKELESLYPQTIVIIFSFLKDIDVLEDILENQN